MASSSNGDAGNGVPPKRSALRSATLILPKTGERVRRVVTLKEPEDGDRIYYDGPSDSASEASREPATPHTPLLGRQAPRVGPSQAGRRRRALHERSAETFHKVRAFIGSRVGMGVLKCSIAYVLGSMGTFVPFLSDFLGDSFGKHMMATVTVYFHPARSVGGMFKAVVCASVAFIYAVFISFTSMAVSLLFDDYLDMLATGHAIVLIVFCGGGLGFVGWVKQALGDPLVNVACSLTSLAIITVLTREGAVQTGEFSPHKIVQVLKMVVMGVFASTVVNLVIKPVYAQRELRQNLIDVTDSLGEMLADITRAFLAGSEQGHESLEAAAERYKKTFSAVTKNAKEAKWEHYVFGTEAQSHLELRLVKSIQQMYQSLGGLRAAAATQFVLLSQTATGSATPANGVASGKSLSTSTIDDFLSSPENVAALAAIAESTGEDAVETLMPDSTGNDEAVSQAMTESDATLPTAHTPSDIFERFISHLGPSMKSLAYTLKQILNELPCSPAPDYTIGFDDQFQLSLDKAIDLYSNARKNALTSLYRSKDLAASRPEAVEADFEEVAASCGHFSYSLLNFAEEMKTYLAILNELKEEINQPLRKRTWNWLRSWRKGTFSKPKRQPTDIERSYVSFQGLSPGSDGITEFDRRIQPVFRLQRKEPRRDLRFRFYKAFRILRRDNVKFAIKVGIGAAIYALPSFVPSWRPFYSTWRGEWGLLSYMLVCSMTIGASNTTGVSRILGTILGALCFIAAWTISSGNVFAMAFFGWLMALWVFYLIVGKGMGPFGRFVMLTYNLTALYAYAISAREAPGHEDEGGNHPRMFQITLHRVMAVSSGCLWGMFIARAVWPISARRRLRDGLSLLLLRMGLIWKRDPLEVFLEGESSHSYFNLKEELELHKYLRQLEELCAAAASEFLLKGPFPKPVYSKVLKHVGHILDSFHAMNVIIMKDPVATTGEAALLQYTVTERAQLCRMMSHLFQVLASSIKLRFPLSDALPNTNGARDRLLSKVFRYRVENNKLGTHNDEDYALIYAYALVTGQIAEEIGNVAHELEQLFGTLDEDLLKLE